MIECSCCKHYLPGLTLTAKDKALGTKAFTASCPHCLAVYEIRVKRILPPKISAERLKATRNR